MRSPAPPTRSLGQSTFRDTEVALNFREGRLDLRLCSKAVRCPDRSSHSQRGDVLLRNVGNFRWPTVVKETVLRLGDLKIDLLSRTVTRAGRNIDLLPREFQVLEYLVRNEATSFLGQCCCSMYGICIRPHDQRRRRLCWASAARSTVSTPTRSSTPCVASGFVSVLLTKALHADVTPFGSEASARPVLSLVTPIWSAATHVRSRSDRTIEQTLRHAYDPGGRDRLIADIDEAGRYLLRGCFSCFGRRRSQGLQSLGRMGKFESLVPLVDCQSKGEALRDIEGGRGGRLQKRRKV
jgi:hypothetical protein